jgi:hypothetical protein
MIFFNDASPAQLTDFESAMPTGGSKQKKIVPGQFNLRKFRSEEELLDYFEMKAHDAFDRDNIEEEKNEEDELIANKRKDSLKKTKTPGKKREDSQDSLKQNI